jgi:hypothetical protein
LDSGKSGTVGTTNVINDVTDESECRLPCLFAVDPFNGAFIPQRGKEAAQNRFQFIKVERRNDGIKTITIGLVSS